MAFKFFNRNKNKDNEPDYDPTNIKITDIRKGFVFEYNMKDWLVEEEYTYDWGNEHYSKEFKISDGTNDFFMSVDYDDELEIGLYKKVKLTVFDVDIAEEIVKNEQPPYKLVFQDKTFTRENETPGYYRDESTGGDWEELISWNYYEPSEEYTITIEQWGERKFEAAFGKLIDDHEISNILPSSEG